MFAFVGLVLSWGPVFHQTAATEFAKEYLPHLPVEQRNSFILGSVFIDGLPKRESHDFEWVKRLLRQFENNTNEWWFVMGFVLHLSVDIAGHMGEPHAYLPLRGRLQHYFAELTVCSTMLRTRNLSVLRSNSVSERVYEKAFGMSSRRFAKLYRMWRGVASLPVHKFLDAIESDKCAVKSESGFGYCNLEMHLRAIKGIMWDVLCGLMTSDFTQENLGNVARRQLERLKCCK